MYTCIVYIVYSVHCIANSAYRLSVSFAYKNPHWLDQQVVLAKYCSTLLLIVWVIHGWCLRNTSCIIQPVVAQYVIHTVYHMQMRELSLSKDYFRNVCLKSKPFEIQTLKFVRSSKGLLILHMKFILWMRLDPRFCIYPKVCRSPSYYDDHSRSPD